MKTRTLPLSDLDLRFLPLCRPKAKDITKMAAALKQQGQISPVVMTGRVLIDGFTRYEAAKKLGLTHIQTMDLDMDLIRAKAMIFVLNRRKKHSLIQEAALVRELVHKDGLSQKEVAVLLNRHKSWVNRRLLLITSLAPEIIKDIQLELVPPGSGLHLARLHTCNQADVSTAIQSHGLSRDQVRTLTDLWVKAGDIQIRNFLLQNPKLAISHYEEEQKTSKIFKALWKMLKALENELGQEDIVLAALTLIKSNLEILEQRSSYEPSQ